MKPALDPVVEPRVDGREKASHTIEGNREVSDPAGGETRRDGLHRRPDVRDIKKCLTNHHVVRLRRRGKMVKCVGSVDSDIEPIVGISGAGRSDIKQRLVHVNSVVLNGHVGPLVDSLGGRPGASPDLTDP